MDNNIRTLERQAALGDPSAIRSLERARNRAGIRTTSTDVRLCYLDRRDLAAAVEADHPCDDAVGCDIAFALESGYEEVAAHLLVGATECPETEAALERMDIYGQSDEVGGGQYMFPRGWDEWCQHHSECGHECPECGGYSFETEWGGPPDYCHNCHAEFPQPEEEEDEED